MITERKFVNRTENRRIDALWPASPGVALRAQGDQAPLLVALRVVTNAATWLTRSASTQGLR